MSFIWNYFFGIPSTVTSVAPEIPSAEEDNLAEASPIELQAVESSSLPSDSNDFKIRNFAVDPITKGDRSTISVIIGARGSGKSTLAKNLVTSDKFSQIHIIDNTYQYNPTYDSIPNVTYYDKYEDKILADVIRNQSRLSNDDRKHVMIVIEDSALLDMQFKESFKYIFINGRFLKISMILIFQHPMSLPMLFRHNIDYAFLIGQRKTNVFTRNTYEKYASIFPTFELYQTVTKEICKNYGCLVIDYLSHSEKLEDQVYWYNSHITK